MKQNSRPIRVVAGLVFRNQQLLICQRRATASFALKWEFPGGKVESGESDIEALGRELKEELAIFVHDAELVSQYEHCYENGLAVSLGFYRVTNFAGQPKNLTFEEMLWIELANLKDFDFLEGDRPVIQQIVAQEIDLLSEQSQRPR